MVGVVASVPLLYLYSLSSYRVDNFSVSDMRRRACVQGGSCDDSEFILLCIYIDIGV